ncbi:MAG: response regulator [Bryobacteraceae bacterium]
MSKCQLVLIEDNPADVLLVEMAMKQYGVDCEMITFSSGQEALRVLCPPEGAAITEFVPDIILLDLNTPKSDGFEVLIRITRTPRLAHVPIAIITSSQATSDRARAARLGDIRYIQKPSQLEAFLSTVGLAIKEMLGPVGMTKGSGS